MTNLPASIPPWAFPVLFVTGLAAGFVDSIAGGGGLITLPVFFSFGFPPQLALGTNKFQSIFGTGSATWHYAQSRVVHLSDCGLGILFTFLGAIAGTLTVEKLDPAFLKHAVPILLLAIAAFTILRPKLGAEDIHPRVSGGGFIPWRGFCLAFTTVSSGRPSAFFGPCPSCSASASTSPKPPATPRL